MRYLVFYLLLLIGHSFFAQKKLIVDYSLENPTFLDSTISDYNVIFTAEIHWNKYNIERKKYMISYLANQQHLDKVILENSYAFTYWLNQFLEKGDTLLLKEILSYYNASDFYIQKKGGKRIIGKRYQNSYDYYLWYRNFINKNNLSIPFVGVDLEYVDNPKPAVWSFIKYIELLNSVNNINNRLTKNIKEAKLLLNQDYIKINQFKKWFNALEKNVENNDIKDKFILNYIFNINQSIPFARGAKMNYREKEILENFNKYVCINDKVYGQFGLPHITLSKGKRTALQSFSSILNQNKEYQGKILSIGLVCYECKMAEYPNIDYYQPFLTKDEFERLSPEFKKLPSNTFVDLRKTNEKIKEFVQLLLIVHG